MLVIHGGNDSVVPVAQSLELKRDNAELKIIDSADHFYKKEEMLQAVEYIKSFLKRKWNIKLFEIATNL
jgi:alpha/beta superfamily hydrolase